MTAKNSARAVNTINVEYWPTEFNFPFCESKQVRESGQKFLNNVNDRVRETRDTVADYLVSTSE